MNYLMQPYDDALKLILEKGVSRTNKRTGIKTLSIFGLQSRYSLDSDYFPIVTKRKMWPKSVFAELLWFLSGSTNNNDLNKIGCKFWDPWVDPEWEKKQGFVEGSFGPVYGFQLRHFGGFYGDGSPLQYEWGFELEPSGDQTCVYKQVKYGEGGFDQLKWVVERIKEDPSCRRTLWSLWNPKDVKNMRLPPCHLYYQVFVDDERRLTGMMVQRSADEMVGVPANVQFYSALTKMIAQQTDCIAHELVHVRGDAHIYEDQLDAAEEYLKREPIESPKLEIKKAEDIFSYTLDNFILSDYNPSPKIDIPVAV